MKQVIQVVCINVSRMKTEGRIINSNGAYKPLIIGKVYNATIVGDNSYMVDGWWERRTDFISLSEYRESKLNQLGI